MNTNSNPKGVFYDVQKEEEKVYNTYQFLLEYWQFAIPKTTVIDICLNLQSLGWLDHEYCDRVFTCILKHSKSVKNEGWSAFPSRAIIILTTMRSLSPPRATIKLCQIHLPSTLKPKSLMCST